MAASCSDMSTSTASSRPRRMPHTSRSSPSAVTLPASALQAWQAACSFCALVFQAHFATGGRDHRAGLRCASKVQCRVTDVTHQLGGNTIRHIPQVCSRPSRPRRTLQWLYQCQRLPRPQVLPRSLPAIPRVNERRHQERKRQDINCAPMMTPQLVSQQASIPMCVHMSLPDFCHM